MSETKEELQSRTRQIVRVLKKQYPSVTCALNHSNPFELLVATILSAQCTDERVNIVTQTLFRKYHSPADYLAVPREELEQDIKSINLFRNKARAIQGACQLLLEKYNGQLPRTMAELTLLPGVGRKTANVVLGTAFGLPTGVVVDTHVARLSQRLGLTENKLPEKIEADLMELLPQKEWIDFSHRLICHGRQICTARKPLCAQCPLATICPSAFLINAAGS
jgi:endonuclease III